jgi:predicted RNase H-like HicB family nuclease
VTQLLWDGQAAFTALSNLISLSAVLSPDSSGGYVALCPELDVASQGETIDEAMRKLKEAVEGFFEIASAEEVQTRGIKVGTLQSIIRQSGIGRAPFIV